MGETTNLINCTVKAVIPSFILCLCLLSSGALRRAYGQESAAETVGTMEISQQVDNGVNQNAPKRSINTKRPQDTNNVTEPAGRAPAKPAPAPMCPPAVAPDTNADANIPEVNDFNAFKRELDRIDVSARGEDAQWLDKQEKKTELAQAMNNVVVGELRFLRKVAASANDVNTMEAVDLLLKKRQDRLQKLVTKIEGEAKEDRQQQRERRASRMNTQQQGQPQTQTERPARSTNPSQRATTTTQEQQQ